VTSRTKPFLTVLTALLLIYVLGFFFITPLMLSSPASLKGISQSTFNVAYHSPIKSLPDNNALKNYWFKLNAYWCEKHSTCEISDE